MKNTKSKKKSQTGRKKSRLWFIGFWLLINLAYVSNEYYSIRLIWESLFPVHYKQFEEFGIKLPTQYSINGIDVSHHQGSINWEMVKNMRDNTVSLQFSFIKATEGVSFTDSRFDENWLNSKKNGLIRGAYHYFNPNEKGELQANHFIGNVKLSSGDLPPVIDVEEVGEVSPSRLMEGVLICAKKLEKHYGIKPIIYTYHDFYKQNFDTTFNNYPIWIAHYYKNSPHHKRWKFWQHNDKGRVSGINYPVDFNVFFGDSTQFSSFLVK